jgi:hypothetical protein
MNIFRFGIFAVVVAMIAACAQQQQAVAAEAELQPFGVKKAAFRIFNVILKVRTDSGQPPRLDILNNLTGNCDKFVDNFKRGCIVAELGETVDVGFMLVGPTNWWFAEFQICSTPDTSDKPNFLTCGLSPDQADEWIVTTGTELRNPGSNGKVDISALANNLQQFRLLDLNLSVADYFYRVCVTNGKEIACTDPGGQNKGR